MSFRISLRFGNYAYLCRFVGVLKLEEAFGARLGEDGRARRKIQVEEPRRRAKEKQNQEKK